MLRAEVASRGTADVRLTSHAGEETALAERAARDGATTILALGGDGTWGNVVRGIMASGTDTRMALVAAGTGNDLAFSTGVPAHDLKAAVEVAYGDEERRIDVGEVDGVHFVNCAGFGFDAEVLRGTHDVKWLRGHAVYLYTAARMLFSYQAIHAHVLFEEEPTTSRSTTSDGSAPHLAVVIANGPRFGGGFLIAPGAAVDDGMFDVVQIVDAAPLRRAFLFAQLMGGKHVSAPEVTLRRAPSVTLEFRSPPLFDADGELHQASSSSLVVRCLPRALRLAVGARRRSAD